jgi:hypothetical protein
MVLFPTKTFGSFRYPGLLKGIQGGGKWSMGLARNFGKALFAAVFRHWTKTNSPHGNAFNGLFFQLAQASQFAEMAPSVMMMN